MKVETVLKNATGKNTEDAVCQAKGKVSKRTAAGAESGSRDALL